MNNRITTLKGSLVLIAAAVCAFVLIYHAQSIYQTAIVDVSAKFKLADSSDSLSPTVIFLTSGTAWTVPSDWNNSNNSIEVIGGGGGGVDGSNGQVGGGGGGYSKSTNVSLTLNANVAIQVGAGGADNNPGTDSYLCNSISNCASISGSAVIAGAKGGGSNVGGGGAVSAGGSASSGVGSVKYSGGNSGAGNDGDGGAGGGGAAGPNGSGAAGGNNGAGGTIYAGAGGGGADGGTAGTAPISTSFNGTAGGNNSTGTGGGSGGVNNGANPGAGTNGGGGGGAAYTQSGAAGGNGTEWDSAHGSGGGGGGNGGTYGTQAGAGGYYGGGGGGGGNYGGSESGAAGGPGIIVITYVSTGVGGSDTTAPSTPTGLSIGTVFSSTVGLSWNVSTDNVGVTGYKIYRNNSQITTTGSNTYSDTGLAANTQYSYTVAAYDAAGNTSSQSSSVSTTTLSIPQLSANIYISNSGNGTGTSCASPLSAAWFNTSANWGSGANQIGPGDTVHLCGNITTNLAAQGSGTSGHPITILFESGATMSKPAWSGIIIDLDFHDYITVDGGARGLIGSVAGNPTAYGNGIIEDTDNGTASVTNPLTGRLYGNQVWSIGVSGEDSHHIIVKNLIIRNLYVRVSGDDPNCGSVSTEAGTNACGIAVGTSWDGNSAPSDWLVDNDVFHDMNAGFQIGYGPGSANFTMSSTTAYDVNWGGSADDDGPSTSMTNLLVKNNYFHDFVNWDDPENTFHHNGFYAFAEDYGTLNDVTYADNTVGPNFSVGLPDNQTSGLFISGRGVKKATVYNNTFIYNTQTDPPSNGLIFIWPGEGSVTRVYNNTFILAGGYAIAMGLYGSYGTTTDPMTFDIKNNLVYNGGPGVDVSWLGTMNVTSDYNIFSGLPITEAFAQSVDGTGNFATFSQWQTWFGYDQHSAIEDPLLVNPSPSNGNYTLTAESPAIGAGTNLTSLCSTVPGLCVDAVGTSRPSSGPWDIGAYEYCTSNCGIVTPPIVLPVLSGISVSLVSTSSATIIWTSDELSTTQVEYGLTGNYGNNTSLVSSLGTTHTQTLTNLIPNTTYHFAVLSADGSGNTATGVDDTFVTLATSTPVVQTIVSGSGSVTYSSGGGGGISSVPVSAAATTQSTTTGALQSSTVSSVVPSTVVSAPLISITSTLVPGMSNAQVVALQRFLVSQGLLAQKYVTGFYGALTTAAVTSFQKQKGIVTSGTITTTGLGMVGPRTSAAIDKIISATNLSNGTSVVPATSPSVTVTKTPVSSSVQTATLAVTFSRNLTIGSIGTDVKALQVYLNDQGFTIASSGNGSPGKETNYFGAETQKALARFQKAHAIAPSNGYFGPITRAFILK